MINILLASFIRTARENVKPLTIDLSYNDVKREFMMLHEV